jgi:hypothetical protein
LGRRSSPRGSRPGASKIEDVFITPFLRRFFFDEKPILCQDRLGTSLMKPLVGKNPAFVWSSRRCIPLGEDYLDDESVRPKPHTLHALSQRNQKRYAFAKTGSGQNETVWYSVFKIKMVTASAADLDGCRLSHGARKRLPAALPRLPNRHNRGAETSLLCDFIL